MNQGEIGLQRPGGVNHSGPDFITAARDNSTGEMNIFVNDAKSSVVGRFPTPSTSIPLTWGDEVQSAISPIRLNVGDAALEAEIRAAFDNGNVFPRQININYSPAPSGQGSITGFGR